MRLSVYDIDDQRVALKKLGQLAADSIGDPLVIETAKQCVRNCGSREDRCELAAIFNAVKHGDRGVPALRRGFKYIADPRSMDYFQKPSASLRMGLSGANGGDCDDHTSLVCALAGSLGFKMGLRAWGQGRGDFEHVYAVAAIPKRGPFTRVLGMDTTVEESTLGWEPPKGNILTAWLE